MKSIVCLVLWLGLGGSLWAQAPDSLADTVIYIRLYNPIADHRTSYSYRWIKADGTYQTIWEDSDRMGSGYYTHLPASGALKYQKLSATTARVVFEGSDQMTTNAGSELRTISIPYDLTFPATGSSEGGIGGADGYLYVGGSGTFTLRKAQSAGVTNLSSRTSINPNTPAIVGFVLPPGQGRLVLVRAIGATLARYGVTGTAGTMHATLYSGSTALAPVNRTPWSASANSVTAFAKIFSSVSAFPLEPTLGEACFIAELPAGAYTVSASSDTSGVGLVEVYFLP